MAVVTKITFLFVVLFAPKRGLVSALTRRHRQRYSFAEKTLMFHLWHHEGTPEENDEAMVQTIRLYMHWDKRFAKRKIICYSAS